MSKNTSESDYRHQFHAGNVGDVLKHCALVALLNARAPEPLHVIETHAGAGCYKLAATGEWCQGIGRLGDLPASAPALLGDYLRVIKDVGVWKERPKVYPGSPLIALSAMVEGDALTCFEIIPEVHARLVKRLKSPRVEARQEDGLLGVIECLKGKAGRRLVHVDPPYAEKREWRDVSGAVVEVWRSAPEAQLMLWYPIKSGRTRSNAMLTRIREAGVPATAIELVTTPFKATSRRLNGSGVLLVNPSEGVVSTISAALPLMGARCATHHGEWSMRVESWEGRPGV